MGHDRYNVIVVGAGLAGSATALHCAKNNLSVLLVERGKQPGSKNMFGGVIYQQAISELIPSFWEKAPVERSITREELWIMDTDSFVLMGFENRKYGKQPYNKFTVIRSDFDNWFAAQAVKEGAHLKNSTTVSDIIFENNHFLKRKACGILLEDGSEIYSDVVVIAEGAVGDLIHKAKMKKEKKADSLALYVKEILELPGQTIEERFNLEKNEGVNIGMSGTPTSGAIGKAGLWTNKKSISLVIGVFLNQLIDKNINPYQLMQNFKNNPFLKKRLQGAKTRQYLAHLIPKGGPGDMPAVFDHGLLIVGDALTMVGGKGTAFAVLSGKYAGETIVQAAAKGCFDKNILKSYKNKLFNMFMTKDNLAQNNKKEYFKKHSDADLLMAKALNKLGNEYSKFEFRTNKQKYQEIGQEIRTLQSVPKSISDLITGLKNWRLL